MSDSQQNLDLVELERVAKEATPGPWVVWSSLYEHMIAQLRSANTTVEGVALAEFYRLSNGYKNAAFIAAANPAIVLSLLSRLKKAVGERESLREQLRLRMIAWSEAETAEIEWELRCEASEARAHALEEERALDKAEIHMLTEEEARVSVIAERLRARSHALEGALRPFAHGCADGDLKLAAERARALLSPEPRQEDNTDEERI